MNTLSVTKFAQLANPGVCLRCWWYDTHGGLPWQIFPSVFRDLDAASKKVTEQWISQRHAPPPWLAPYNIVELIPPPDWRNFFFDRGGLRIRGVADCIGRTMDNKIIVIDYKTAKFTGRQDELVPIYACQLNGYAECAEARGLGQVDDLLLIYCEPQPEPLDALDGDGFAVSFRPLVKRVQRRPERVYELMDQVQGLMELEKPPPGRDECRDCATLNRIIAASR